MPTGCCVPQCTKKGYLDENGGKVLTSRFQMIRFCAKNGFTLLEEMWD